MDDEPEGAKSRSGAMLGGLLLVALLGAGGYAFISAMAPTYDPSEFLAKGEDFEGEIISAQKTGDAYEGKAVYELELQVHSDEGRGHRAFHRQPFNAADEPKLTKTTKVRMKVDPDDRRNLWVVEVGVE